MRVLFDRGDASRSARDRHRKRPDAGVQVEHTIRFGARQHVERGLIEDEHLLVVGLYERVAADPKGQTPELQAHRVVEQHLVGQQRPDSLREHVARPLGFLASMAQAPHQPLAGRLHGEKQVLEVGDLQLVRGLRKCGQGLLYAQVVDEAHIDWQHRVRPQSMEAETPALTGRHRLELAPDSVAPRVVHAQHRRVRRQPQPHSRPGFLDDLSLELQLMRVRGVLPLAASAGAEVWASGLHALR